MNVELLGGLTKAIVYHIINKKKVHNVIFSCLQNVFGEKTWRTYFIY